MDPLLRRTKIVATIGPASLDPGVIRQLIVAGMDVVRLNFSHGSYADHASTIAHVRAIAEELDTPITILQDLQGPKVRVGQLPGGERRLEPGEVIALVPESDYQQEPSAIPIDYPFAAEEARPGTRVLLADGLLELETIEVAGRALRCRVLDGGVLKSRKGVNFPSLSLRLPALTAKDERDLEFGLGQGVDWISLSFVRSAEDMRVLKRWLASHGAQKPVIAKIEKPQALEHLPEILVETSGVMVARGDLGVEMSPEKVPMLQKSIIESCNRQGVPVITATQMLESMVQEPRPTRAEASDVANAIIDGTDAVMLSAETAIGVHPARAVEMMARIARDVESRISFKSYPAAGQSDTHALSESVSVIEQGVHPRCIAVLTTSGNTARSVAAERPKALVVALTTDPRVYHELNLVWGLKPLLVKATPDSFEGLVGLVESTLCERQLIIPGDKVIILGGIPARQPLGTNFLKIHTVR